MKANLRPIVIGAFPPPVHGMSSVNQYVYDQLAQKCSPIKVNVNAPLHPVMKIDFLKKLSKLLWIPFLIVHCCYLRCTQKNRVLYLGMSGGVGVYFEALILLVLTNKKTVIYVHHHSFQYLNQKKCYMDFMVRVLQGKKATHITLCETMGRKLNQLYSETTDKTIVISNAAFIPPVTNLAVSNSRTEQNVGFLSNVCFEKGILEFCEIAKKISKIDTTIRFIVAGPAMDTKTEWYLNQQTESLANFEWIGPVYGGDKATFLQKLDVLVFPSKYKNEAEPLTLHECHSVGVPVISTAIGCTPSMITDDENGLTVRQNNDFVQRATDSIQFLLNATKSTQIKRSAQIIKKYTETHIKAKAQFDDLILKIIREG